MSKWNLIFKYCNRSGKYELIVVLSFFDWGWLYDFHIDELSYSLAVDLLCLDGDDDSDGEDDFYDVASSLG